MLRWNLIRQFPKFALALGIILASIVVLFVWQVSRASKRPATAARSSSAATPAPEDNSAKLALIESKPFHLLLVDNDLYDVDDGTLLFKSWLKEGMPQKLFYDEKAKKFLAQYERGFVRYGVAGAVEATLAFKTKPAINDDYKWVLYVKDKDIWRADIDWNGLKQINDRKLTSIEQFNEAFFADNIMLGTEKTVVVRNMGNLLRIDLETGTVKPVRIPLNEIGKRRSPDSKSVVGVENGTFYCYDVDSDQTKTIPIGRGAINDYQWLGNDRCIAIAAMKTAVLYDRTKHTLTELTALPTQCFKIGEPSFDGHFVFCVGRGNGVLLDVEKRTATPVVGGSGVCWASNDTFAFSREVPDSGLRGSWLQRVGEVERRISESPFLVSNAGPSVLQIGGLALFVTRDGLSKLVQATGEGETVIKWSAPPRRVLELKAWKQ